MSKIYRFLFYLVIFSSLSSCQTIKDFDEKLNLSKNESEEVKNSKKNVNNNKIISIEQSVYDYSQIGEYEEAYKLAKKYENADSSLILNDLGTFYHNGTGTQINYKKAMYYYDKAIIKGSIIAYSNKGLLYEKGHGVTKNIKKALSLYQKGNELGDVSAASNLALLYLKGKGIEKNTKIGIKLLEKAASKGNVFAINELGYYYLNGIHVKKDYKKALEFYLKGHKLNNVVSTHQIGFIYDAGWGVEQNTSLALKYYLESASKNYALSAYNIGLIYHDTKDQYYSLSNALKYFKLGAELGNNLSKIKLDVVKKQIKKQEIASATLNENKNLLRGLKLNEAEKSFLNSKNFYALVISVEDYKHLDKLKTPINDGKVIGKLLNKKYGFKTKYLNNPNRDDITRALNDLQKNLKETDNLLIYYAGHGIEVNNDGYWLPKNAKKSDDTYWLSNDYLTRKIKNIKASNVLVLSDSCYSGTLTRNLNIDKNEEKPLSVYLNTKSRMVITSGGLSPVLDSGGAGHSIFARFLINYLSTNDKNFTATDMYTSINKKVTNLSSNLGVTQVPVLASLPRSGHVGPDFVFIKK